MEYYVHPISGLIQPDARRATTVITFAERRTSTAERTTSEQYAYLRDCLSRLETAHDKMGKDERHVRHLLVVAAVAFLAIAFAPTGFQIDVDLLGTKFALTRVQLGVAFPIVLIYLIIFASYLGGRRLRMRHECRVIALELERFGCPTQYSIVQRYFARTCSPPRGFPASLFRPGPYESVFRTHDLFLFATAALLVVATVNIAREILAGPSAMPPAIRIMLIAYMCVSGAVALAAPILLRIARRNRHDILTRYEQDERLLREAGERSASEHADSKKEGWTDRKDPPTQN